MLISSYGLFWKRKLVNWGKGRSKGTLEGYCAGAKRSGNVDFRDQAGIYVLYDDNFRIIYVGQAGSSSQNLFTRLKNHKSDHLAQRWSRFSWFGTKDIDWESGRTVSGEKQFQTNLKGVLDHIEAILLAAAEPPLNLQRGRFGSEVFQFIQPEEDEEAED